jgi:hypothetical protein
MNVHHPLTGTIESRVRQLLRELPSHVVLVAAAKGRTAEEINQAVCAGIEVVGENYLNETLRVYEEVQGKVKWHFIGHLQTNKVKKTVRIFDMIETVDSVRLAREIDKRCDALGKVMSVLIEVNSGKEPQKFGVLPDEVEKLIREISRFENIRVDGLMTMAPLTATADEARPYFRRTRQLFEHIKQLGISRVQMKYLSMGMSHTYRVAIEEGANIVRIGTLIFGPRE